MIKYNCKPYLVCFPCGRVLFRNRCTIEYFRTERNHPSVPAAPVARRNGSENSAPPESTQPFRRSPLRLFSVFFVISVPENSASISMTLGAIPSPLPDPWRPPWAISTLSAIVATTTTPKAASATSMQDITVRNGVDSSALIRCLILLHGLGGYKRPLGRKTCRKNNLLF